ncbi:unnamed protein product [Heterosigma akashiwo]
MIAFQAQTLWGTVLLALLCCISGFQNGFSVGRPGTSLQNSRVGTKLFAANVGKEYTPKWKKQQTLADQLGIDSKSDPQQAGLVGDIPVVFKQGNDTLTTLAIAGQPISAVAAQAGQFIRYGCKKGECGTCEVNCDGKWVRPCVDKLPAAAPGKKLVIQVKAIKAKSKSSGKFFSFRSFIMGFWNNLLGMFGFVKQRRAAKKNWEERIEMEERIKRLTEEKRRARLAA